MSSSLAARAWFEDYARELKAGDRSAIVARYHHDGAWIVRNGVPKLLSSKDLEARYRQPQWQPPVHFKWKDLVLEPVGEGGLLAVGQLLWKAEGANTAQLYSYTGLLLQVDGKWRIRLEDENFAGLVEV
jgi:hypothetical protein